MRLLMLSGGIGTSVALGTVHAHPRLKFTQALLEELDLKHFANSG
jgi:hypothetical protein